MSANNGKYLIIYQLAFFSVTEQQCLSTILDLLGGGIATLVTQLNWLLLLLAHRPETQQKAYSEIQRVAGSRRVTPEDRKNMPYAEAVVLEVTYK